MVLSTYQAKNREPRLVVRGPAERLEEIGAVLERLFPESIFVLSDEDEPLTSDQVEVLNAMADDQLQYQAQWPVPVH